MKYIVEFDNNFNKKIKIDVHDNDLRQLDIVLAPLLQKCLIELKKNKNGTPYVDYSDIPEHLRTPEDLSESATHDGAWSEKAWDWILDEMIWAFGQIITDWEEKYCYGNFERQLAPHGKNFTFERGEGDNFYTDLDGKANHSNRMIKALTLFGKYYVSLWA